MLGKIHVSVSPAGETGRRLSEILQDLNQDMYSTQTRAPIRLWSVCLVLFSLIGCHYDAEEAEKLVETRHLVDDTVQAEVDRLKAAFKASEPHFDGVRMSPPVPDAFNDGFDRNNPGQPAFGGRTRIAYNNQPKRLTYFMDNSAVTSEINRYVFNGLVYTDPDTLDTLPDLATSWERQDVVWLKGHRDDSVFEARLPQRTAPEVENNYVIGTLIDSAIVYAADDPSRVQQLTLKTEDGQERVIAGDELRIRVNDDGSYKRVFDRGVIFTFHLRQGVKFHDGKDFSADDVVFTLDVISNPRIPDLTPIRSAFTSVKHWEKVNDSTVKVYLDEQYFAALDLFSDSFTILPKHLFWPEGQTFTVDEFAKHFQDHPAIDKPVGTGPYAFPSALVLDKFNPMKEETGWLPGNYVKLVRTGEFWDPARRGYLDEVLWYFFNDADNILRAMNNGEVDFTRFFGSDELFKKSNTPEFLKKYVKIFYYTPSYGFISLNTRKPYFSDKRVRQAFNILVDRARFSNNLSYGIAALISGPDYCFGPSYNHDIPVPDYNRKRAEELLNEAGWVDTDGDGIRDKDGIPFVLEFIISQGRRGIGESIGYLLKEDLASMGIVLDLRRLEWASLLEHIDDRKFDMYNLSYTSDIESDPYGSFHSSQWADKGQNTSGYNSPEADQIILAIRRELDYGKRMLLHQKLHALLAEDVPSLFLFTYPDRGAYDGRLRNVKFSGFRPGYFAYQWYIPAELQTDDERKRARERWGDTPVHAVLKPGEAAALANPPATTTPEPQ